jgi:hypothetical protein
MSWTPIKQKRKFSSCQQFSAFFLSKIFGNRICQTWYKQLENEGIRGIFNNALIFVRVLPKDVLKCGKKKRERNC